MHTLTRSIEAAAARMVGVTALRHAARLPLSVISAVVLARLYSPRDFGTFALLSFVATLPLMVGDVGLVDTFVRRPDDPAPEEIAAASSLQLWITVVALFPVLAAALFLDRVTPRASVVSLTLTLYVPVLLAGMTFRASVLVSRRLDFARLNGLDLVQQITYIVLLAIAGVLRKGTTGLVVASTLPLVARHLVLMWWYPARVARWPSWRVLSGPARTAMPLKASYVVAGFWVGMVNWLGAPLFGPASVGYLRWGLDIASKTGTSLAHSVGSVLYPAIALVQENRTRLSKLVGRSCRYNALLVGVPMGLLAGLAAPVILAVFGRRWLPAATAMQIFALYAALEAINVPLNSAFLVLRHPSRSLGLETARLGLAVILFLGSTRWLGLLAAPLSYVAATGAMTFGLTRSIPRDARPDLRAELALPSLAAVLCFGVALWAAHALAPWWALVVGTPAGASAALLTLRVLGGGRLWPEFRADLRRVLAT